VNYINKIQETYIQSPYINEQAYSKFSTISLLHQIEALPLGSKGNKRAMNPAIKNKAPAMKIGTGVFKLAYRATMGA